MNATTMFNMLRSAFTSRSTLVAAHIEARTCPCGRGKRPEDVRCGTCEKDAHLYGRRGYR
jgi:hypothetical protein